MPAARDIVVIGGGHNGLVTAFYLARAGLTPLVLERRDLVGGAAVTEEFYPGFKCPVLAHWSGPLRPEIVHDMRLDGREIQMLYPDPVVFAPAPDGRGLLLYSDAAKSAQEIARFCQKDARNYVEFERALAQMAGVLSHVLSITPPSIDHPSANDLWNLLKAGRGFRSLGKKEMFRLLRWGPMAVADLVAEWFDTELVRAVVAARGVFGTALGPWSAGSAAVLLLRAATDAHPAGTASFPRGGMGALTQAMADAARRAGAEVRTGAEVAQIAVKDGAVTGVVLADGEEIAAKAVVSGADPRRTFLRLLDPVHLEPDFVVKMQHYRCPGTTAKVNLALASLPAFKALSDASPGALARFGRARFGRARQVKRR